jgi:3-oxoacyl-[acyl-carrier protein] reductase
VPNRSLAIVVLGGSRGIGRSIVERALADGHRVFAGARGEADLATLQRAPASPPGTLRTATVDAGDDASVRAFYAAAGAALGPIDVVVNSAAVEGHGRLAEMSPEAIEAIVRTNLLGVLFSCRHAALAMAPGGGHIINIGSEVAYRAVPLKSVYSATKFAVRGLSDALELELAPSGIRVSQVHPGWVDTGLHDEERRRTGGVSRPRGAATPAGQIADAVAELWQCGGPRRVASLRARLRGVVGEIFPAWARWRTRRAFADQLEDA